MGKILSVDSTSLQFESVLGVTTIAIASIASVREEAPGEVRGGRYFFPNPNATRLIFAPTGRMLRKGEGYFNDFWIFFPAVVQGVTDRVSFGGGMSIIPGVNPTRQVYFLTPKLGIVQSEKFNAAVGALAGFLPSDVNESTQAGILYGVGTWGGPENSFTAGLGYGYLGATIANSPVFMFGGETRALPRISLVSENYVFTGGQGIASGGVRFLARGISVDFALAHPFFGGSDSFTFPLLGFMWKW